jgi:hypothetical protein
MSRWIRIKASEYILQFSHVGFVPCVRFFLLPRFLGISDGRAHDREEASLLVETKDGAELGEDHHGDVLLLFIVVLVQLEYIENIGGPIKYLLGLSEVGLSSAHVTLALHWQLLGFDLIWDSP